MAAMSSVAPLDYATPVRGRRLGRFPVRPPTLLLCVAAGLLAVDVFVLALPAFSPFYTRSLMVGVAESAYRVFDHASWVVSIFALVMIGACWYFKPVGRALRLARSIALGMALYHWFFAPGMGVYGRLLWGAC